MQKLIYIWSLRNAAADRAGQYIDFKGGQRYMMSPLEYLVGQLNHTALGESYSLVGVINDDDELSIKDREKLSEVGFSPSQREQWLLPKNLEVKGKKLTDMLMTIPSAYRRLPLNSHERISGKKAFEKALEKKLIELDADLVVLDGLLVILDELVRPGSLFHRKVVNIHPGITRLESPYEHRGAYATLDALYGAQGKKVINWQTMAIKSVPPLLKTGASFHYVDNGIDSGEVITDALNTNINPNDTILELRWNNFQRSLFPALIQGLEIIAQRESSRSPVAAVEG